MTEERYKEAIRLAYEDLKTILDDNYKEKNRYGNKKFNNSKK